jgi:epsilon-lactone hydrolase
VLLLRLALLLPFLFLKTLFLRLAGRLPSRWTLRFGVAVELLKLLVQRITPPLLQGAKLTLPSPPLRGRLGRTTVCTPRTLAGRPAETIAPLGQAPQRTILYLHGGAFVTGSIGTHRRLMALLARAAQAKVIGLDYRLAPEHRFPAALDDCLAAYQALLAEGCEPRHLGLAGDSAGGGLTASTLLLLRQRGLPLPAAAWMLSPALDLSAPVVPEPQMRWDYLAPLADQLDGLVGAYLPAGADPRDPLVSPLLADPSGLPPLLLHVGGYEALAGQARAFAQKARAAGVDCTLIEAEQLIHVYPAFAGLLPEASVALSQAGAFFQRHT